MSMQETWRVIDARDLEPPEPFVLTMEALDLLPHGQRLTLLLRREPFPLYRALANNGFTHDTVRNDDGSLAVIIRHID